MATSSGRRTAWCSARATWAQNFKRLETSVSADASSDPEHDEELFTDLLGRHLPQEILSRFNGILATDL